jgi:hypothetical protein
MLYKPVVPLPSRRYVESVNRKKPIISFRAYSAAHTFT